MQIAARLLMTAAAAAVNAVAGTANDAPATTADPTADAGASFGALLASALSPDTGTAADTLLSPGAGRDAATGSEATAQDSTGMPAEISPTPDLMLQALLMATQATGAPAASAPAMADAEALPADAQGRTVDAALPAAATALPDAEKITDRKAGAFTGARQTDAANTAVANAGAAGAPPAPSAPALPFPEAMRAHERESELPAAAPAAMACAPAATELPATQAVRHVSAPLSSARWEQALGEQVLWVAQKDLQTASLTLNPPELGPVRVELQLNDAQAIASFSSQQPEVRKAIEDALPSLKAMFADAGLQLQQANVGSGDAGQQAAHRRQVDGGGVAAHDADDVPASIAASPLPVRASNRLLDTFA